MENSRLYTELIKPSWSPPSYVFGPVWTILYIIIFATFGTVFYKAYIKEISFLTALPFLLNIIFNLLFTYLQFELRNNYLAAVDIILILITLIWAIIAIWNASPNLRWIAYFNIPYLIWVAFATSLQLTITYLNK